MTVRALKPADIPEATTARNLTIHPIERDRVGLADKLQAYAVKVEVDGMPWFRIVDDRDTARLFEAWRRKEAGLSDANLSIGRFSGATAMIAGSVDSQGVHDDFFRKKRTECLDKKCHKTRDYYIFCTRRKITMDVHLRLVSLSDGHIIYARHYRKKFDRSHCNDEATGLPSPDEIWNDFAEAIAEDFISKLVPGYTYHEVVLLDAPDIDFTDEQRELLKSALKYLEFGRYKMAERQLAKLMRSTGGRSAVAAYDLGVVEESQGRLEEARELYLQAERLASEPIEAIENALVRIQKSIQDTKIAKRQLRR